VKTSDHNLRHPHRAPTGLPRLLCTLSIIAALASWTLAGATRGLNRDLNVADAGLFQVVFTGPRGGSTPAPDNPYLFTGRRLDFDIRDEDGSLTGQPGRPLLVLYDYRAREYDPFHGRFCQRDPAEYADSLNLYEYVRSNPLVSTDPSGRQLVDVLMATLGQSELRGQEAYRAGVAGALILSMLGAYITYNEFGQMQWGVMGGLSAEGFDLFTQGIDALVTGQYVVAERLLAASLLMVGKLTGSVSEAAAALGLSEEQVRKAIHAIKKALRLGGRYNVQIDTQTGDVYVNDELIGNIFDELESLGLL